MEESKDFNSDIEVVRYIMDGGFITALLYYQTTIYYGLSVDKTRFTYYSKRTNKEIETTNGLSFDSYKYYEKYEPVDTSWYNNIPEQGVLCEVRDDNIKNKEYRAITIITKYDNTLGHRFININGNCWKYAIPLTDEELENFKIGYKGE